MKALALRLLVVGGLLCGLAPVAAGQGITYFPPASSGTVTSPVTTDPVSATGVWTFDNAANTPVTLSDGAAGGTLCSVGVADTANSVCVGSSAITGEGATADGFETLLAFGDATADATATLTGTASGAQLTVGNGNTTTTPALKGTDADTGISFAAGEVSFITNGTRYWYVTGIYLQALGATSSIQGQGGYQNGFGHFVSTVATTAAPTASSANFLYTNGSDVDGQAVTLPDNPTAGHCYYFALTSTDTSNSFAIAPSAGETLMDATTTCATSFSATAKGSTAHICAVSGGSGGLWLVISKNGTWTCS